MKKLAAYALMSSVVLMTGCASILNKETQPVNVSTTNGKEIKGSVDGTPFVGPGVVMVQRQKAPKIFNVDTAGCAPTTTAASKVDIKFFGNIILGGFLGSSTDFATDKMWKYEDNVVISCTQ